MSTPHDKAEEANEKARHRPKPRAGGSEMVSGRPLKIDVGEKEGIHPREAVVVVTVSEQRDTRVYVEFCRVVENMG